LKPNFEKDKRKKLMEEEEEEEEKKGEILYSPK